MCVGGLMLGACETSWWVTFEPFAAQAATLGVLNAQCQICRVCRAVGEEANKGSLDG